MATVVRRCEGVGAGARRFLVITIKPNGSQHPAVNIRSDISSVISRLGHTDTLVVCDAGLPIPKSTTRIDMALTQGVPSFMQVLGVVTNEMQVEAAIIAEEIKHHNPQLHETLLTHLEQLQKHQGNTIEIRYTTHEQFKQQTAESQAVIRSGECSPYANIILCAGVTF